MATKKDKVNPIPKDFVSREDMARILCVSIASINNYVLLGMPVGHQVGEGRKRKLWFDPVICQQWYMERNSKNDIDETEQQAKIRKLQADANNAELRFAQRRGELIEISIASKLVEREYTIVRSKLKSISSRFAPIALQMETAIEIQNELDKMVDDALAELAADTAEWIEIQNELLNEEDQNGG